VNKNVQMFIFRRPTFELCGSQCLDLTVIMSNRLLSNYSFLLRQMRWTGIC